MAQAPIYRWQRGFTLVEMLVSLVVVAIMTAGAMTLMVQQQRVFQRSATDRAIQETARTAVSELGVNLRRAGFGMEPWLTFDFGTYSCGSPVDCRDHTNAPDEIVFYARDPAFVRTLAVQPTSVTLTITGGFRDTVYPGQILQVMCGRGTAVAYVTVQSKVDANVFPSPAVPPVSTAINLNPGGGAFPNQASALATGCFADDWQNAKVFWIDRFRYHVSRFADPDTGVSRPYLMLDRGLSENGTPLDEPIVPDVEDFQVAYLFPNATANPVVGGPGDGQLVNGMSSIDLATAPPAYTDLAKADSRKTHSPANIQGVRISVVVQNPGPDATLGTEGILAAGNRPLYAGQPNYRYLLIETTEATRNLQSRGPYFQY